MNLFRSLLLGSAACLTLPVLAQAEPAVVVSIKPLHSLVAGVMEGVGEPEVIVDGAASPHTYSLRPSQAGDLEKADVVFWVGPQVSSFLEKPLETLGRDATVVNLSDAPDMTLLDLREGGTFEEHDHAHGEQDEHAEHDDHDDHAKHDDHDDHAKHDDHDDHAKHDDHAGAVNPHFWLDPINAKAMVHLIEEALSRADTDNAGRYEANAKALEKRLDELTTEVSATLEPVRGKSFIVFHDAYPYFENRFGVSAAGSITVSPEVAPGAARVTEIREKVKDIGVTCVFSEPQFEPKLVTVITEGTAAKSGVLDPLGATIDGGPELYFELIRTMANDMRNCLSGNS